MIFSPSSASAISTVAQPIRRDQERRDVGEGLGIHERRSAGQLPDLGEKIARSLPPRWGEMSEGIALRDRDFPLDDDGHAGRDFAGRDQQLTGSVMAEVPKRRRRSISSAPSFGNICARRVSIVDIVATFDLSVYVSVFGA